MEGLKEGVKTVFKRRFPIGAEIGEGGVHFRIWAPNCPELAIQFPSGLVIPLELDHSGYHSGLAPYATADDCYFIKLDEHQFLPDPASRFQPNGPHGTSQIIDPDRFHWTDSDWEGRRIEELVIYELHIGTFTPEGTWASASSELEELARIGITCIEVMPVAEFAGNFGWGYDGVDLFAPSHLYGTPDDFREFVNTAHQNGIAVILDVVYNHLGPDGNYLEKFSSAYFTDKRQTDWGRAINFDGRDSGPVREFFLTNVAYWIKEFHLDGYRLDATQNIYDDSPVQKHIFTEISKVARAAAPNRQIILIAENEPQNSALVRSMPEGGNGLNAIWNDDFHHSAMVALTGQRHAYFTDYQGSPQEFVSMAKYGFLFQGQWYSWQTNPRGTASLDLLPTAYVTFLQNHDQIANSGKGLRVHQLTSPARYRAMMSYSILQNSIPMLFQGQEFASSAPFLFFADHTTELAKLVQKGREDFLTQFPRLKDPAITSQLAPPHEIQTFERCKLNFAERDSHAEVYQLTKDLLKIRQKLVEQVFNQFRRVDGSIISPLAFLLRIFAEDSSRDQILLVNLGSDLQFATLSEPLFAPPCGKQWKISFSSEDDRYGGSGIFELVTEEGKLQIPAEATLLLEAISTDQQC